MHDDTDALPTIRLHQDAVRWLTGGDEITAMVDTAELPRVDQWPRVDRDNSTRWARAQRDATAVAQGRARLIDAHDYEGLRRLRDALYAWNPEERNP